MNITVNKASEAWINRRVSSGDYANASDYINDLIREDQAREPHGEELAALLRKGLESGVSKRSVHDIVAETEASLRAGGRL